MFILYNCIRLCVCVYALQAFTDYFDQCNLVLQMCVCVFIKLLIYIYIYIYIYINSIKIKNYNTACLVESDNYSRAKYVLADYYD